MHSANKARSLGVSKLEPSWTESHHLRLMADGHQA